MTVSAGASMSPKFDGVPGAPAADNWISANLRKLHLTDPRKSNEINLYLGGFCILAEIGLAANR
jgi:hypothetical protein